MIIIQFVFGIGLVLLLFAWVGRQLNNDPVNSKPSNSVWVYKEFLVWGDFQYGFSQYRGQYSYNRYYRVNDYIDVLKLHPDLVSDIQTILDQTPTLFQATAKRLYTRIDEYSKELTIGHDRIKQEIHKRQIHNTITKLLKEK